MIGMMIAISILCPSQEAAEALRDNGLADGVLHPHEVISEGCTLLPRPGRGIILEYFSQKDIRLEEQTLDTIIFHVGDPVSGQTAWTVGIRLKEEEAI